MKEHHHQPQHHHLGGDFQSHGHPHHHHQHRWSMTMLLSSFGLLVCLFEISWLYRRFGGGEPSYHPYILNNDDDNDDDFLFMLSQQQHWHADNNNNNNNTTQVEADNLSRKDVVVKRTKNIEITRRHDQFVVCSEQMQQVFQRHRCMLQLSRGGGDEEACLQLPPPMLQEGDNQSVTTTTTTRKLASSPLSSVVVAAPVHHLSYLWGQGFGRIVQHGVRNCLLAALLNRPCSIDMIRDKYHNLRSFIRPGPHYDWDQASRIVMGQHGKNISHALYMMPQGIEKGHGWESLVVGGVPAHQAPIPAAVENSTTAASKSLLPKYDDVLPMVWGAVYKKGNSNQKLIQQHLDQ